MRNQGIFYYYLKKVFGIIPKFFRWMFRNRGGKNSFVGLIQAIIFTFLLIYGIFFPNPVRTMFARAFVPILDWRDANSTMALGGQDVTTNNFANQAISDTIRNVANESTSTTASLDDLKNGAQINVSKGRGSVNEEKDAMGQILRDPYPASDILTFTNGYVNASAPVEIKATEPVNGPNGNYILDIGKARFSEKLKTNLVKYKKLNDDRAVGVLGTLSSNIQENQGSNLDDPKGFTGQSGMTKTWLLPRELSGNSIKQNTVMTTVPAEKALTQLTNKIRTQLLAHSDTIVQFEFRAIYNGQTPVPQAFDINMLSSDGALNNEYIVLNTTLDKTINYTNGEIK